MDNEVLIKLLKHRDPEVKELAKEFSQILRSPHYKTYAIIQGQIDDWNEQLEVRKSEKVLDAEGKVKGVKGRIDLFADADNKDFDRVLKYFSEVTKLHDILDTLRKKMSPEEIKKTEEIKSNDGEPDSDFQKALDKARGQ